VTYVSYADACAFCEWCGLRLPTEFEWEAAARKGRDDTRENYWPWGDETPRVGVHFGGLLSGGPLVTSKLPTFPQVGSFPHGKNPLTMASDMCGSVAEFTQSPFTPYWGFKSQMVGKRTVASTNFNEYQVVVRGGHIYNTPEYQTTFWRLGVTTRSPASLVGFRTAATPIRGKDHLDALFKNGEFDRFLVDFPLLPSDVFRRLKVPTLALDDPLRYTALMSGGCDPVTGLPERARFVSILNRKANDFSNVEKLNYYEGERGEPILLGFMHLDIEVEEPELSPGNYLILWRPAREDPTAHATPDQVLFYDMAKSKSEIVAMDMSSHQPLFARAQATTIRKTGKNGEGVVLVFAFPIKYKRRNSFIVTIPLKTKPEVTSEYK